MEKNNSATFSAFKYAIYNSRWHTMPCNDSVLAKRGYMKQKRSSLRHGDTHFETEKTAFWSPNGTGVSLVNTISLKAFMKRKELSYLVHENSEKLFIPSVDSKALSCQLQPHKLPEVLRWPRKVTSSTQKCEGASERRRRGSAESRIRVTAMMLTLMVSKMRMLVMMGQTTMMRCAARMPAVAVITVTMSP